VTLKSGLEVTQGHWNWCYSKSLLQVWKFRDRLRSWALVPVFLNPTVLAVTTRQSSRFWGCEALLLAAHLSGHGDRVLFRLVVMLLMTVTMPEVMLELITQPAASRRHHTVMHHNQLMWLSCGQHYTIQTASSGSAITSSTSTHCVSIMPNLFIFHVQLFSRDMQGHHFYIENINRKGDIISHKNWKKTENGEIIIHKS